MNEKAFFARFLIIVPEQVRRERIPERGGGLAPLDAWVLAADSENARAYLDGNTHLHDCFVDIKDVPGVGIWVWEGWVWCYAEGYYEPEVCSGEHLDVWRRASADELWRMRQGYRVFSHVAPKRYPCRDSHMPYEVSEALP